jgi:hypothetical protein
MQWLHLHMLLSLLPAFLPPEDLQNTLSLALDRPQ